MKKEEEEKIKVIPHWKWLLKNFFKKDFKGWLIIIIGFSLAIFFAECLAIGICAQLGIENTRFIKGLVFFGFIIIALVIENATEKHN